MADLSWLRGHLLSAKWHSSAQWLGGLVLSWLSGPKLLPSQLFSTLLCKHSADTRHRVIEMPWSYMHNVTDQPSVLKLGKE
eukprot:692299-Pelagomonas_calceolata.AAC.3